MLMTSSVTAMPRLREPAEDFPALLIGSDQGVGNGCSIGVVVLTAKHVTAAGELRWNVGTEVGSVEVLRRFDEDLAVLRLLRVDGTHYTATPIRRVAKEAPRSGDPLRALVTYKDERGPWRIVVHLRALNIDASGDLIMDGLSFPGVSGSCIINESDEIVAIFAGTQHSALPVRERGYAVPVWGRKL